MRARFAEAMLIWPVARLLFCRRRRDADAPQTLRQCYTLLCETRAAIGDRRRV